MKRKNEAWYRKGVKTQLKYKQTRKYYNKDVNPKTRQREALTFVSELGPLSRDNNLLDWCNVENYLKLVR